MKINVTEILHGTDGKPLREVVLDEEEEVEEGKEPKTPSLPCCEHECSAQVKMKMVDMTMRSALKQALEHTPAAEAAGRTASTCVERFVLAMEIMKKDTIKLLSEEVSLLKTLLNARFPQALVIVAAATLILDPTENKRKSQD